MGKQATTRWHANALMAFAALLVAALVACAMAVAPRAYADEDLSAGSAGAGLGAQAASDYYSDYALVKANGDVCRCDSVGNALGGGDIWGESVADSKESLNTVTSLFIAADATNLDKLNVKYTDTKTQNLAITIRDHMPNLQKVTFLLNEGKSAVKSMPDHVFDGERFLGSVMNLDKTQLVAVPEYAFRNCKAIASMVIPDSVVHVYNYAFYGCKGMSTIEFGSNSKLQGIHGNAFYGCSKLGNDKALELPADLREIDKNAFYNCQALTTIVLKGSAHTTDIYGTSTFRNTGLKAVYVANRFVSDYQESDSMATWKDYRGLIHGWLEVSKPGDVTYSGAAHEPVPAVTWCGSELAPSNYATAYSNNTDAGTATVEVTGLGAYATTSSATFTINPAQLTAAKLASTKATYAGRQLEPAVSGVKAGKLTVGNAGYTVSYKDNDKVGKASVTVSGTGNFTGSVTKTFKIIPFNLSGATVSGVKGKAYTGTALKQSSLKVKAHGATLEAGRDYRLVYSNNKKVGTAKVTVSGKGNYSGSVTKTFAILPASIAKAKLALSKTKLGYTGKAQVPTVKTVGGKKLKAGRDYTVKCSNAKSKNVGKYSVKVVGKGSYAGTSASATYRIVKAANPMKVAFKPVNLGVKSSFSIKKSLKVTGAKGKVTFRKASGNSLVKISKDGKMTVSNALPAGNYPITVKVTAAGNANYKAKTVSLSFCLARAY